MEDIDVAPCSELTIALQSLLAGSEFELQLVGEIGPLIIGGVTAFADGDGD